MKKVDPAVPFVAPSSANSTGGVRKKQHRPSIFRSFINVVHPQKFCNECKEGRLVTVKMLVEQGADPNSSMVDGTSALHGAVINGYLKVVEYLVENCDVNINAPTKKQITPLHSAIENNFIDILKYLCLNGADANKETIRGYTPFIIACGSGNLQAVIYLHELGVDCLKCTKYNDTPFQFAAHGGHIEVLQYLCNKKIMGLVDNRNKFGSTPFHDAVKNGHIEAVKYIKEVCLADSNICDLNDSTPFFTACQIGSFEMVKFLCRYNADMTRCNGGHLSPMQIAVTNGFVEIVSFLEASGIEKKGTKESDPRSAKFPENGIRPVRESILARRELKKKDGDKKSSGWDCFEVFDSCGGIT